MDKKHKIAAYARISVDTEADRDSTSIENQKDIITDYTNKHFPDSEIVFYVDRDRSGYTFEQRESYMTMRPLLMSGYYDILIVKDLSRFSRRNSRGLVELEDLRDAGVRIIAIGDGIDYPTYDDWTNIRLRFLLNEMPISDSSQKVRAVIDRRQRSGKWICSVPYGYAITNSKLMTFEIDPAAAVVVVKIYELYNSGWGYKKIACYLTAQGIPTPRMAEKARKEARGEVCKIKAKPEWSIVTIVEILTNDFYIGVLRQGKYKRLGINGKDFKQDEEKQIVFYDHHEAIVNKSIFDYAQEERKRRQRSCYRGVKKYYNPYSGFIYCGDCGSRMFAMSRKDLAPAYVCGAYQKFGLRKCTAHHTRMDVLDGLLKQYVAQVKKHSLSIMNELNKAIESDVKTGANVGLTMSSIETQIEKVKEHMRLLTKQKLVELMRKPDQEDMINETFDALEAEDVAMLTGLQNQISMIEEKERNEKKVSKLTISALEVFDSILEKEKLDKQDIEIIVDRITVFNNKIEIKLRSNIAGLLDAKNEEKIAYKPPSRSCVETRPVTVVSNGDPSQTTVELSDASRIIMCLSEVVEACEVYKEISKEIKPQYHRSKLSIAGAVPAAMEVTYEIEIQKVTKMGYRINRYPIFL